jgi:hypothetical protein
MFGRVTWWVLAVRDRGPAAHQSRWSDGPAPRRGVSGGGRLLVWRSGGPGPPALTKVAILPTVGLADVRSGDLVGVGGPGARTGSPSIEAERGTWPPARGLGRGSFGGVGVRWSGPLPLTKVPIGPIFGLAHVRLPDGRTGWSLTDYVRHEC